MLDTNCFDSLLELGETELHKLKESFQFFVLTIQRQEIANTPDETKRKKLLEVWDNLDPSIIPNETTVLNGFARVGSTKLGIGYNYKKILSSSKKNINDSLIAEAAFLNGGTLVTGDSKLIKKARKELKIEVLHIDQFLAGVIL